MLPTKFRFIWPSGFRGEDLKKSANQKQELPMVAMFVDGSGQNEQSLERTFHRCFLTSFTSFGWAVSEEKIKMWKVNGRRTTDAKWWQKLTLPLARWAKKYKRTNNDLQNKYKTKDRVTQTPLKTGDELRCSRRVSSACSTSDTRRNKLVTNPVIRHERGKDQ